MLVTVTQLNNYLKGVVDTDSTLSNIEVSGEVTGAKFSHGYWFFGIKDENSQFDCFAFGDRIDNVTNGMQVIVSGSVGFLPKSGRLSLTVSKITEVTQGQSYLQYLQLKNKLDKLGLFDIARKKSLPYMPDRVGVITSKTGAVIKDICDVVSRRQPFCDVVLYPVKVQGVGAIETIVEALQYMSTANVDVVILARGGGSDQDLSLFNEEAVVLALSQCAKPTISAIGHGVDYTLCDMVADVRAVTPTEAGELATVDSSRIIAEIGVLLQDMDSAVSHRVMLARQQITGVVKNMLTMYSSSIEIAHLGVVAKLTDMGKNINNMIDSATAGVQLVSNRINANNPLRLQQLGYHVVYSNDSVVTSQQQLIVGQSVQILMEGGSVVHATVTAIDEK